MSENILFLPFNQFRGFRVGPNPKLETQNAKLSLTPVKINIYVSYTESDMAVLGKLLHWLYPMRDEINVWFRNPPRPAPPLPTPWKLLFFWYQPPDLLGQYSKVLKAQMERAHIYLFLTNYKSLSDRRIDAEIEIAVTRRVQGAHELNPHIYPVITTPCQWKSHSRLGGYKPLGPKKSLAEIKPEEEGYLELTEQLTKVIRSIQTPLNEAKYALSKLNPEEQKLLKPNLYLNDDPNATVFKAPSVNYPPEWLGWAVILILFLSVVGAIVRENPRIIRTKYEGAEKEDVRPPEYRRENPMMPPPEGEGAPKSAE